jgi:hypothetical protein
MTSHQNILSLEVDKSIFGILIKDDFEGITQQIEDAVAGTLGSFQSPKGIFDDMRAHLCDHPQQLGLTSPQLMVNDF